MKSLARKLGTMLIAAAAMLIPAAPASAQLISKELPKEFQGVDLVSKLGDQVPLDLKFTNGEGKQVTLGSYFRPGRPVILALVYFRCPMTCPLVLDKLQQGLNGLSYIVGEEFNTLVISFDPTETAETAATNKLLYLGGYNKPVTPVIKSGWDFLVSPDSSASTLAASVGFQYKLIPESGQYSHPMALVVLTPEGKVARYISGIDYTSKDLRLALLEASEGKVAQSMGDFFLHLCFRFDASTGKYTMHAFRVMQLGSILTAVSLATLITGLRASERLKRHRQAAAARRAQGLAATPPSSVASLIGQAR